MSAAAGEAMAAARTAISAVVSRNERILPNFALTRARAGGSEHFVESAEVMVAMGALEHRSPQ